VVSTGDEDAMDAITRAAAAVEDEAVLDEVVDARGMRGTRYGTDNREAAEPVEPAQ
jgi:L-aminopeptidase/D-esterase-like protein